MSEDKIPTPINYNYSNLETEELKVPEAAIDNNQMQQEQEVELKYEEEYVPLERFQEFLDLLEEDKILRKKEKEKKKEQERLEKLKKKK